MHDNIEKVSSETPDLALERQRQLRALFPEAWSEGELNVAALREWLGDLSDESAERYRFGWAGKREALQLLQHRSHATLTPDAQSSVEFDTTRNWFIEGDNLEVLKLLYKPLFGRVKMIYIDPPYNTGNDFIYPDNFADPLRNYLIQTGQKDENGDSQTSDPDTAGRVHSRWLSMLYPRLTLARSLLRDDGVIFVSIDDKEFHHLRLLMNEVFGEDNLINEKVFVWHIPDGTNKGHIARAHEYVVGYAKNISMLAPFKRSAAQSSISTERCTNAPTKENPTSPLTFKKGLRYEGNDASFSGIIGGKEPIEIVGTMNFVQGVLSEDATLKSSWRNKNQILSYLEDGVAFDEKGQKVTEIFFDSGGKPKYSKELEFYSPKSVQNFTFSTFEKEMIVEISFDNPKPAQMVKFLARLLTDQDDIILDFFAGSGTTAQAVLELNREDGGNRRFVLVQLPEKTGNAQFPTIADIGEERIRRVIARMKDADQGTLDVSTRETPEDLGFKVWKLAPSHFHQLQRTEPGDTAGYLRQLELLNDALLPGSQTQSVLYEVALREGFGLNCHLEPVADLQGVNVWRVTDSEREQRFYISLDETLELETLRPLKLTQDDLFICRGVALDDDTAANLTLQCRLKMI